MPMLMLKEREGGGGYQRVVLAHSCLSMLKEREGGGGVSTFCFRSFMPIDAKGEGRERRGINMLFQLIHAYLDAKGEGKGRRVSKLF